jgi:hypothetical protein
MSPGLSIGFFWSESPRRHTVTIFEMSFTSLLGCGAYCLWSNKLDRTIAQLLEIVLFINFGKP